MTAMTRQAQLSLRDRFACLPRFARHEDGVAAVEFGFIAPLMVLLYCGRVAVTMAVKCDRKVTLFTSALGDIVAQGTNLTSAQATDVFNAARAIMSPYNSSVNVLKARVSSVKVNAAGTKACVRWSRSPNSGYARTTGDDVTSLVPPDLLVANTYLVVPETEYKYDAVIGAWTIGGTSLTLSDKMFMRPRQSDEVTTDGQNLAACP
jgi:Flp pilus assembly protein TadG